MGDILRVQTFGVGGVNLSIDPLKMQDSEATQLQNAEVIPDVNTGGMGALRQRGGLAALNGSAMSGLVIGIQGWPLKTTYTRTLYASLQSLDNDSTAGTTWRTTTNGTSWSDTSSPSDTAATDAKYQDEGDNRDARRMVAFRNYILFPGNSYTQDTDDPEITLWDGSNMYVVVPVRPGPSGNGSPAFAITDMLVANGKIYLAVHEPGGTAPDNAGRVLSLSLDTGKLSQIATGFAPSGAVPTETGGAPSCLAFYQGQLYVGLNHENTTDAVGHVYKCFPDIATDWTTDVATLSGSVSSLNVFKGKLYAGTQSSVSSAAKIYERSPTAGTWSAVFTGSGAAQNAFVGSLHVYDGALYAVEYDEGGDTDVGIIHIKRSTDGTSWATDRDVDSDDSGVDGNIPGQMVTFNNGTTSDLYVMFQSTSVTATDGFIMRRSGGTWTKVDTDNFGRCMSVLVQRSA